ncbi:MAG: hypothetical protein RXR41_02130 [Candidatus Marsarchaeota archaeon]
MKPKVKLEITDSNGGKITLTMSGAFDPVKLNKIMDVIQDVAQPQANDAEDDGRRGTLIDALYEAIQHFGDQWFDSKSAREQLKQKYGREIPLPVVSTYLSRMRDEGKLLTRGNRVHREYHLP